MKRLLVTCEYPPIIGGQASYFHNLWSGLPKEDNCILVPKQCESACMSDSMSTYAYASLVLGEQWHTRIQRLLVLIVSVGKICIKNRPQQLHFGQLVVGGICGFCMWLFFRIPYIVHCHGADVLEFSRSRFSRIILSIIFAYAKRVIVNSAYTLQCVKKIYTLKTTISVVNPSVSSQFFFHNEHNLEKIRDIYQLKNKKVIITTGRLVERKGHDVLIRSIPHILQKIDNVVYLVIGSGPQSDRLHAIVRECKLESTVVFMNSVSTQDLPSYYASASVFAMVPRYLPAKGDVEGFGIVYLEANAAGIPVVASRSGGIQDCVVDGYNGLLVDDPTDSIHIAQTIVTLLGNTALYNRLSQNALRQAKKFSKEQQRKIWLEVLS